MPHSLVITIPLILDHDVQTKRLSGKRTVADFLYQLTPDEDMHDRSGPLTHPSTGQTIPHIASYFTEDGCQLQSHS